MIHKEKEKVRRSIPLSIALHPEAHAILRVACPGLNRGIGDYVSRLIFEDAVRREMRGQAIAGPEVSETREKA